MRRIATFVLTAALSIYGMPSLAVAAPQSGAITGVAQSSSGAPFANHTARLRSVNTGELTSTTSTGPLGNFEFPGVRAGSYVIEVTDLSGRVVATSGITAVVNGGVVVAQITAVAPIVGGALATPLLIMLLAGSAAGAVGIYSAGKGEASPSR